MHDFGVLKYDPSQLLHTAPVALALRPDQCTIGTEIRILGNDAGEREQILAGTIARVDRNPPEYGDGTWNDYNVAYVGAASNTSGGSSGSPVINISGNAVALNAGGASRAASAMYLPLYPVKRAVELIQAGKYVPRGDIHTQFLLQSLSECRKLGLPAEVEKEVREAEAQRVAALGVEGAELDSEDMRYNMPVVEAVLPAGAAAPDRSFPSPVPGSSLSLGSLQAGDILYKVEGKFAGGDFQRLERALDAAIERTMAMDAEALNVASRAAGVVLHPPPTACRAHGNGRLPGDATPADSTDSAASELAVLAPSSSARAVCGVVEVSVFRNGELVHVQLPVVDAHAHVPRLFLQIGGAMLSEVPYTLSLGANRPAGGVQVLEPGMMLASLASVGPVNGAIIQAIDGVQVPTLPHVAALLASFSEGSTRQFTVYELADHMSPPQAAAAAIHRKFAQCRLLSRNIMEDILSATAGSHSAEAGALTSPAARRRAAVLSTSRMETAAEACHREWRVTPLPSVQEGASAEASIHHMAVLMGSLSSQVLGPAATESVLAMLGSAGDDGQGESPSLAGQATHGTHVQDGTKGAVIVAGALQELKAAKAALQDAGFASPALSKRRSRSQGLVPDAPLAKLPRGVAGDAVALLQATARILVQQRVAGLSTAQAKKPGVLHTALALVTVSVQHPFPIEGVGGGGMMSFDLMALLSGQMSSGGGGKTGTGVIVDLQRGLVLVSKATLPILMSIVTVQVGPMRVPGRVVFIHPTADVAIVQFDTQRTGLVHVLREVRVGLAGPLDTRYSEAIMNSAQNAIAAHAACAGSTPLEDRDACLAATKDRCCTYFDEAVVDILESKGPDAVVRLATEADAPRLVVSHDKRPGPVIATDMLRGAYRKWSLSEDMHVVSLATDNSVQATTLERWGTPSLRTGQQLAYSGEVSDANRVGDSDVWGLDMLPLLRMAGGGVAVDVRSGEVRGILSSSGELLGAEYFGHAVRQVINRISTGAPVSLRSLELSLQPISVNDAVLHFGMSLERAALLMQALPSNSMFQVRQSPHPALRHNDILLAFEPSSALADGVNLAPAGAELVIKGSPPKPEEWWVSPMELSQGLLPPPVRRSLPILSATQLAARSTDVEFVTLRVLRGGEEYFVRVPTSDVDVRAASSKEVLSWCGMYMHEADAVLRRVLPPRSVPHLVPPKHRALWPEEFQPAEAEAPAGTAGSGIASLALPRGLASAMDVMLRTWPRGSTGPREKARVICSYIDPNADVGVQGTVWVTEVNGVPTPTLADVLHVITRVGDGEAVRVKLQAISTGQSAVISVTTNNLAFPVTRFVHTQDLTWEREVITAPYPPTKDLAGPAADAGQGTGTPLPAPSLARSSSLDGLQADADMPPAGPVPLLRQSTLSAVPDLAQAGPSPMGDGAVGQTEQSTLVLSDAEEAKLKELLGEALSKEWVPGRGEGVSDDELAWWADVAVNCAAFGALVGLGYLARRHADKAQGLWRRAASSLGSLPGLLGLGSSTSGAGK